MDDVAHIGLVDTHTEGDGRNNDIDTLHQEVVLIVGSRLGIHTCVVCQRLDTIGHKQLGQFLNLLAAQAVDDTTLARALLDEADDIVLGIMLGANLVKEI